MFMNLYVVLVIKYFWVTGETNNGFLKVLKIPGVHNWTTFEPKYLKKHAYEEVKQPWWKLDIMNR